MFKIMKKPMLLTGNHASNSASCHLSLKEEDDCLQTWVLLKVGDRKDRERGYKSFLLMQDLYMLVLLTPRSSSR